VFKLNYEGNAVRHRRKRGPHNFDGMSSSTLELAVAHDGMTDLKTKYIPIKQCVQVHDGYRVRKLDIAVQLIMLYMRESVNDDCAGRKIMLCDYNTRNWVQHIKVRQENTPT
jgi:hypothetical protein